jgi:hypothetical protein
MPGPEDAWRHLRCFNGPVAAIAARDEAAASDAYLDVERVNAAMQHAGLPAGRPLVLAVSREDPLLFPEPATTVQELARLHTQVIGEAEGHTHHQWSFDEGGDLLELASHVMAAAVPVDAKEFDLPASWRDGIAWLVVLPTTACSDAIASEMLDLALAKRDLSFGERLLLAPMMPFVRSKARSELRREVRKQLLDAAIAAARRCGTVRDEAVQQVRQELGLGSP